MGVTGRREHLKRLVTRIVTAGPVVDSYARVSWRLNRRKIAGRNGRLRLHVGAGSTRLDEWVNVDVVPDPRLLTMRIPAGLRRFADASVEYIYASHFLEHLSYPREAHGFLRHCHRLLIPGGALRIVVPDIALIVRAYAAGDEEFFVRQRSMHPAWCTTKLEHLLYALQQDGEHRYGYDFETLKKALNQVGFDDVRRTGYRQSAIADLNVDYRSEVDPSGRSLHLHVDAVKTTAPT